MTEARGRNPASPSSGLWATCWRSLRTESHWEGGNWGLAGGAFYVNLWISFSMKSMLMSKYIWIALPVVAILRFPVASFIDMDLLTCDTVFATLKPTCLVVVMRSTWKKKHRVTKNSEENQSLQDFAGCSGLSDVTPDFLKTHDSCWNVFWRFVAVKSCCISGFYCRHF